MAPTEILADQHYAGLGAMLAPLGYAPFDDGDAGAGRPNIARLVGSMPPRAKERVRAAIAAGDVDLVVGTHAVIQDSVRFHRLGLAVVDEQHRFGVLQRAGIREVAAGEPVPHQLVMTATPIPRTLALVLNADLDQSVIDELPAGRQPVETTWLQGAERAHAYEFARGRVAAGEQAFLICPLVEASDRLDVASAVEEHERLQREVFPELRLGLVHGRMAAADKEAVMRAFRGRDLDILVATTVIEVGVDVPNATVMIVDGADRFGLAQLHQLRGRVGRGPGGGWCLLLAEAPSAAAAERLTALTRTTDGLALAELDLAQRGPGDYFGLRQSGETDRFRHARLADTELIAAANRSAKAILASDPDLATPDYAGLRARVERHVAATDRS
jgi:ATP-dependent DNA helicase RecG